MTVVNKFNVNREQVTLDADIIENMSANDVSYNSSTQYDENTVGEKLSELESDVNGVQFSWTPGYIDQYGDLVPPDGFSQITSRRLYVTEVNGIVVTFDGEYRIRLAYFDGNTLVSRSALLDSDKSPYTISTQYDVYISLMTKTSGTSYSIAEMLEHYSFSKENGLKIRVQDLETDLQGEIDTRLSQINVCNIRIEELNATLNGLTMQWISGNIDAYGSFVEQTQSNYYSQTIPNSIVNGMSLQSDNGYICNLAFYENGVFKGRYGWIYSSTGKVTISTQYDARIMIAINTADNTKTAEEIASHIHLEGIEPSVFNRFDNLKERVDVIENSGRNKFLANLIACDFDGKILHFSFDDTCWCLFDLIQNVSVYDSIFDEPFFAMLKEIHDTTGMVFTLNTFNEITTNTSGYYPTGFNITNVTTKFRADFQAHKGWLRFSFHAKDENTNYNTSGNAETDYATFVSAIYTLTGDYECIDRIARFGYFGGTKENCLALRDADYGLIGFYGADDSRSYDYYLTSDEYSFLRRKGKYIDLDNELLFIKTQYRSLSTGKQDVENNLCFQKLTEFFAHEYEAHYGESWNLNSMKSNILSLATWAAGLGYKFVFPEDIVG